MNKRELVREITSHLAGELADLERSQPGSARAVELVGLLNMYRFLPLPDYGDGDVACPASLVELESLESGRATQVLIVPKGGGLVLSWEGFPVQVLTPESPLGSALLGKSAGQTFEVSGSSGMRSYRVAQIR